MGRYEDVRESIRETNDLLMQELINNNITKAQFESLGTSIATGFSICNKNVPFLSRNENLQEAADKHGIELEFHQFSRSENNSEANTFTEIIKNTPESTFNQRTRRDYNMYKKKGEQLLTDDELDTYYPIQLENDKNIRDTIFDSKQNTANIVIANFGTGSAIDNWTRHGRHKFTNGVDRDRSYTEAILGLIQLNNRDNYANTQVYLCAAPRIANTILCDLFINRPMKAAAKRYANVTYIPSFSRKLLYLKEGKIPIPDPHYDEEEYLHLIEEIEKAIIDNYQNKDYLIDIDRQLVNRSTQIELSEKQENTRDEILTTIEKYADLVESKGKDRNKFLKTTRDYLLEIYPYSLFYLDHKAIKDSAKVLAKK